MPNRMIESKRKYIVMKGVGTSTGFARKILLWWWDTRTKLMSEGEILKLFYDLTGE